MSNGELRRQEVAAEWRNEERCPSLPTNVMSDLRSIHSTSSPPPVTTMTSRMHLAAISVFVSYCCVCSRVIARLLHKRMWLFSFQCIFFNLVSKVDKCKKSTKYTINSANNKHEHSTIYCQLLNNLVICKRHSVRGDWSVISIADRTVWICFLACCLGFLTPHL